MAFPAIDILGVVSAAGLAARTGVHRLAVDAGRGARLSRLFLSADTVAQGVVDRVQGTVVPPTVEVAPHGALGWEVLGKLTPLASGPHQVEDGIDNVAHRRLAGPTAGVDGDTAFDECPLLVGHITGVVLSSHTL